MCRAVQCKVCGKTTWAGCGQHVDAVRRGVPAGQWCPGGHSEDEMPPRRWSLSRMKGFFIKS